MMGQHGRNLRSRARLAAAAEAAREAMIRDERALLARTRSKLAAAQDFLQRVEYLVGRTAIIAGAPISQDFASMMLQHAREAGIRVIPHRNLQPLTVDSLNRPMSMQVERFYVETLHLLDHEVVRDLMSQTIHMRVELAGGEVRYAISGTALRRLDDEYVMKLLAKELMRGLAPKLRR